MKQRESGIEISLATLCDAQPVFEITLSAFEAYRGVLDPPTGVFSETIADVRRAIEGKGVAVARVDEMPVGAVRWEPRDEYLYAGRLAVLPEARGTGVGSALMQFVEGWAAALRLAGGAGRRLFSSARQHCVLYPTRLCPDCDPCSL